MKPTSNKDAEKLQESQSPFAIDVDDPIVAKIKRMSLGLCIANLNQLPPSDTFDSVIDHLRSSDEPHPNIIVWAPLAGYSNDDLADTMEDFYDTLVSSAKLASAPLKTALDSIASRSIAGERVGGREYVPDLETATAAFADAVCIAREALDAHPDVLSDRLMTAPNHAATVATPRTPR